jgi:hypothetical protein
VDGHRVGITLKADPANFRASWWHNRDYGLIVANPFGRAAMKQGGPSSVSVKRGESFRLRFAAAIHAGDSFDPGRFQLIDSTKADPPATVRQTNTLEGWTVLVSQRLLEEQPESTAHALELLRRQLAEIIRVVPAAAAQELQRVPLWVSPEYPGVPPKAEFHPDAGWLRDHGRDPAMAGGVEFTNVRVFAAETRRMPVLVLHELAHAYHHRVLGFDHAGIKAAYEKAKAGGKYDRVERQDSEGRRTFDRAYALTDPQEYFAECTEAFFGRNDFFPFTRDELKQHDPEMFELLGKLWRAP